MLSWSGCDSRHRASLRIHRPTSVVFIVIDTLRADRTSLAGYERDTTPSLAELATESVVFEQAFSSAPSTIPSVPQMFTSSYFPAFQRRRTLPAVLADAGYETSAAIVNNPWAGKWIGGLEPSFGELAHGDFPADEITDRALAWIDANPSRPLALYLHYLDPHTPYEAPPPYAERFIDSSYRGPLGLSFHEPGLAMDPKLTAADRGRIADLYDGNVLYADAAIGRLLEGLRARGILEDALVVVTADHGEELWDHDGFFHGHTLYDELLHVPLLVRFPGAWRGGTRVTTPVGTVDVLPSIVDVLVRGGVSASVKDDAWIGRSLVTLLEDATPAPRTLFATVGRANERKPPRHAVRHEGYKYIATQSDGREELYEPARDPVERSDLVAADASALQRARTQLAALTEPLNASGVHVELSNDGDVAVDYRVSLRVHPAAPFVNLHRLSMDRGDVIEPGVRSDGVLLRGRLEPGDRDRMRFDLMATMGTLRIDADVDGTPLTNDRITVGKSRLLGDGTGVRFAIQELLSPGRAKAEIDGGVRLSVWSETQSSAFASEVLSPEEEQRLQALGYLR
ncbi:MAG: sulfatase [Candidatus Binatia bacterium]